MTRPRTPAPLMTILIKGANVLSIGKPGQTVAVPWPKGEKLIAGGWATRIHMPGDRDAPTNVAPPAEDATEPVTPLDLGIVRADEEDRDANDLPAFAETFMAHADLADESNEADGDGHVRA